MALHVNVPVRFGIYIGVDTKFIIFMPLATPITQLVGWTSCVSLMASVSGTIVGQLAYTFAEESHVVCRECLLGNAWMEVNDCGRVPVVY